LGRASDALVEPVVVTVSVAVATDVPMMLTGVEESKLRVGKSWAAFGLEVMAAVRATMPVKPPAGVTEIVEEFPVVAPVTKLTAVPLTVKTGIVTVSLSVIDVLAENCVVP
jgi:hypothetical protein